MWLIKLGLSVERAESLVEYSGFDNKTQSGIKPKMYLNKSFYLGKDKKRKALDL